MNIRYCFLFHPFNALYMLSVLFLYQRSSAYGLYLHMRTRLSDLCFLIPGSVKSSSAIRSYLKALLLSYNHVDPYHI